MCLNDIAQYFEVSLILRRTMLNLATFQYNWKPKTGRDLIALLYPRSLRTRGRCDIQLLEKKREVQSKPKDRKKSYNGDEVNY